MLRPSATLLIAALLILFGTPAAAQDEPSPALAPDEVVRAQLAGFRAGGDDGIARAFAFASPRNRRVTGPVERFGRMIRNRYSELLGHRDATLTAPRSDDDHTYQGVEITAADGRTHLYVFILSRYERPDCDGCWMIEGVAKRPANPDAKAL